MQIYTKKHDKIIAVRIMRWSFGLKKMDSVTSINVITVDNLNIFKVKLNCEEERVPSFFRPDVRNDIINQWVPKIDKVSL